VVVVSFIHLDVREEVRSVSSDALEQAALVD
jgi:hypothetical protein